MFINNDRVKQFIEKQNYDVRVSQDARWIDQKCTPDVVCIIADAIYNHVEKDLDKKFTVRDIWDSEYTQENVSLVFSKPDVSSDKAQNEYDKFFSQPILLLAYSNILHKEVKNGRNYFTVNKECTDILFHISIKEKFCLDFLNIYIEKVLIDSGLMVYFDEFFSNNTPRNFDKLKQKFIDFTIINTSVKKELEPKRIFTKIINPLAFLRKSHGAKKGRMSPHAITFDMLMYNQNNFRDVYVDKPKNMTRKEYAEQNPGIVTCNNNLFEYQSTKAKRQVKQFNLMFNNGLSEVVDGVELGEKATHAHHVFPEWEFPEISGHLENIINLTPTQHLNHAHPENNTKLISLEYQHICLLAKVKTIKSSLINGFKVYDFDLLVYVLNIGHDTDKYTLIDHADFNGVIAEINLMYN